MKYSTVFVLALCTSAFAQLTPIDEVWEPSGNYPVDQYAKVAVVQWAPPGASPLSSREAAAAYKNRNRLALQGFIQQAANNGADLVITPEFGVVGYPDIPELPPEDDNFQNRAQIDLYAEPVDGTSVQFFKALARQLNVAIHFGFALIENNLVYNSVVAINNQGNVVAVHKKNHLFKIESNYLTAGRNPTVYDSPIGRIGIAICSDIYDRRILNAYRGADVVALSTSWAEYNTGWDFFVRAARSTDTYVLASNHTYFPDTGVINPNGSTQSHIRQSDGITYGYIPWQ